jgi:hypothetical protein
MSYYGARNNLKRGFRGLVSRFYQRVCAVKAKDDRRRVTSDESSVPGRRSTSLAAGRLEFDQEIAKRVDELCRIAIEEKGARCLSKFPLQLVHGRGF